MEAAPVISQESSAPKVASPVGIFQAMAAIMKQIRPIDKGNRNATQNFNFRGIDDVYNELFPLLTEYGVFSVAEVLSNTREERTTTKGGVLAFVTVKMRYKFCALDGSSIPTESLGEGMDSGDKATSKAMAIAHKYALLQAFCIPTKDMTDPDRDGYEVGQKQGNQNTQKQQPPAHSDKPQDDTNWHQKFKENLASLKSFYKDIAYNAAIQETCKYAGHPEYVDPDKIVSRDHANKFYKYVLELLVKKQEEQHPKPGDPVPPPQPEVSAPQQPKPPAQTTSAPPTTHPPTAWDWHQIKPSFDELKQQLGEVRFNELLGEASYLDISKIPNSDTAKDIYKVLLFNARNAAAKKAETQATATPPAPVEQPAAAPPEKQQVPIPEGHPILLMTKDMIFKKMDGQKAAIETFEMLLGDMDSIAGTQVATEAYMNILRGYGVERADQFKTMGTMRQAAVQLLTKVQELAGSVLVTPTNKKEN